MSLSLRSHSLPIAMQPRAAAQPRRATQMPMTAMAMQKKLSVNVFAPSSRAPALTALSVAPSTRSR